MSTSRMRLCALSMIVNTVLVVPAYAHGSYINSSATQNESATGSNAMKDRSNYNNNYRDRHADGSLPAYGEQASAYDNNRSNYGDHVHHDGYDTNR